MAIGIKLAKQRGATFGAPGADLTYYYEESRKKATRFLTSAGIWSRPICS